MAANAELTLKSAERARDAALRAAQEAGATVDLADAEQLSGDAALSDASLAADAARDKYQEASRSAFERGVPGS